MVKGIIGILKINAEGYMEKVYDLAKYKQRKRKLRLKKIFLEGRFTISFLLLFSIDIAIWWLISLKAAIIYTLLILLIPFIIKGEQTNKQNHSSTFRKPQKSLSSKIKNPNF